MASKTFTDMLVSNIKDGKTAARAKASLSWFKNNITRLSSTKKADNVVEMESFTPIRSWTNIGMGSMYFAYYDPKHKETLKYYDNFPLVIPIERYKDGFLGLNLHYLPPVLRAKLLDALMETVNDKSLDDNAKMMVSYKILASVARSKYYKPCIKRYLGKHFVSQFMKVHPSAWESSIYLPVEKFQKASKQEVWSESKRAK